MPVAEVEEVLRRGAAAGEVVGVDGRGVGRAAVRVDGDDGDRAAARDDGGRDEDGAVDEGAAEAGQGALLPADAVVAAQAAGVGEELVPGPVDGLGDALEQLGRERLELGDEDPDDVGLAAPQAPRDDRRLVPEVVDDLLDVAGGLGRDAVATVDHLGDGRDGDAGGARDVADRDSSRGAHGDDSSPWRGRPEARATSCVKRYRYRLTRPGRACQSRYRRPHSGGGPARSRQRAPRCDSTKRTER